MRPQLFRWMLPLLMLPFITCTDSERSNPTSPRALVGPLCQLGCTETDPNPNAPGVFLGSGVTPDACVSGTDSDLDNLGDFCEKNLAAAFAPQLRYTPGDDVRREPRWASRPLAEDEVAIAYLLSYYRDTGSKGAIPGYGAHNGDSEFIVLDVYYDWTSQHWVLNTALYSRHGSVGVYSRGSAAYPVALEYPSRLGGYPRSWVAEGKHANYAHQNECNSGGFQGDDTCVDNIASVRVEAGAPLNIGSRQHHSASQDCMASSNPAYEYYGAGRIECYWTTRRFRGWVPDSIGGGDGGAYSDILSDWGF